MLRSNTDANGNLDTAKVTKALLQYRNTPIPGLGMSPAYMLFGRQLRDALPHRPNTSALQGRPGDVWSDIRHRREIASAKKHLRSAEYYNEHKRPLTPLIVGDSVSIQNRSGTHPLRWDRTGIVVERLENRQYLAKTDGSGRTLLRTRAHLRKIDPATRDSPDQEPVPVDGPHGKPPQEDALHIPGQLADGSKVIHPTETEESSDGRPSGARPCTLAATNARGTCSGSSTPTSRYSGTQTDEDLHTVHAGTTSFRGPPDLGLPGCLPYGHPLGLITDTCPIGGGTDLFEKFRGGDRAYRGDPPCPPL